MMKVWAVSNQKGGVGKTTSVVTLGGLLSAWGFNTLLVDLDPHGSLTSYFDLNPDTVASSVYDIFSQASQGKEMNPKSIICNTRFRGLDLLPAGSAIATLDRQCASVDGMGLAVSRALAKVCNQYDYALIDSPPMLGVLMINALAACQHLVVPVSTDFLAMKGLERMVRTLGMIQKSRKQSLQYTIIPTMFDRRTRASVQSLRYLRDNYKDRLWTSVVPVDTKLRDASQAGVPPPYHVPKSRAIVAYSEFLESLMHRERFTVRAMTG